MDANPPLPPPPPEPGVQKGGDRLVILGFCYWRLVPGDRT